LPEQVWINKPKEVGLGNNIDVLRAVDLPLGGMELKNGFHNCLISNELETGRDLPMAKNQPSEDLVQ